MGDLVDRAQRLNLSGVEVAELTDWPQSLIEDYLGIGESLLDIANAVEQIANVTAPPTLATDAGITGNIAFDSSYFYVCIATDTWKRVAIATW